MATEPKKSTSKSRDALQKERDEALANGQIERANELDRQMAEDQTDK